MPIWKCHGRQRISKNTLIISEINYIDNLYKNGYKIIDIPLLASVKELGSEIYISTVILGFLSALLNVSFDNAAEMIGKRFKDAKKEIVLKNIEALKKGFQIGTGSQAASQADRFY